MTDKAFVIREVGGHDFKAFAVVEHGEAYDGPRWKRKCLFVHGWHEQEDAARAEAHRINNPD